MVVYEEFTPGPDLVIDLTVQRGDGEWNVSVAHPPVPHAWPTMLGLLTIISDAIAAAPWWGSGASGVELPAVGSYWLDEFGAPYMVDGYDIDGPVSHDGTFGLPLENFTNGSYRPATVVPTPTADDWIDPAVRLPDVGEYLWVLVGTAPLVAWIAGRFTDSAPWPDDWVRWAPILVGPPPIPDASEVE